MLQLYTVSYDNFYNSNDIVSIANEGIEKFIAHQTHIEESGEYSGLFNCNFPEDLEHYKLEKLENGDYNLILCFNEYGELEYKTIGLIKSNMYF